jgi:C1A family cysteine protease
MRHAYGWRPDGPDARDRLFAVPYLADLPAKVDMRASFPTVYDQGDLGSCTANMAAGVIQFLQHRQGLPVVGPSRLFVYYHTREREGTVDQDAGGTIRDTIKVCAQLGAPPESDWPYDIARFTEEPSPQAHADALQRQLLQYGRVPQTAEALKSVLASGYPVCFGFTVYESLETPEVARTGRIPMPTRGEGILGGHAVWLIGYEDGPDEWLIPNSWGAGWGDGGFARMPYAYLTTMTWLGRGAYASDFWVPRLLEVPGTPSAA